MNSSGWLKIAFCVCIASSASVNALEFRVVEGTTNIGIERIEKTKPFDILDKVTAPSNVKGFIGFNENVGSLYFQIGAKKRAKIRIEYDNSEVLFPRFDLNEVIFDIPGRVRTINFNVFKPVSGQLRVFNEKNQLLKTVAYTVVRERSYRQSIRTNVTDSSNNAGNNGDQNLSLGYSITKKTTNSTDPYWGVNTSVNVDMNGGNNRTVSAGFSYNW